MGVVCNGLMEGKMKKLTIILIMLLCLPLVSAAPTIKTYFANNSVFSNQTFDLTVFFSGDATQVSYSLDGGANVSFNRLNNDWAYFNNNPIDGFANSVNDDSFAPISPVIAWTRNYSGLHDNYASIKIQDGKGYVGSKFSSARVGKNRTVIFNASTGALIKNFTLPFGTDSGVLIDSDGANIWVATSDGSNATVFKLDKTTLVQQCNFTLGVGCWIQQEMDQSSTQIFFGEGTGAACDTFHAIKKSDCTTDWNYTLASISQGWAGTPKYSNGRVACGFVDGGAVKGTTGFNSITGEAIWNITDAVRGWDVWDSQPTLDDDGFFYLADYDFAGGGANFCQFYWINGSSRWCFTEPPITTITSSAAIDGDFVYHASSHKNQEGAARFYKFYKENGTQVCNRTLDESQQSYNNIAISNNIAYMTGLNRSTPPTGAFYAINTTDCAEIFRYDIGNGTFSGVSITDGLVYFSADDNMTYALGDYLPTYTRAVSATNGTHTIKIYGVDGSGDVNSTIYHFESRFFPEPSTTKTATGKLVSAFGLLAGLMAIVIIVIVGIFTTIAIKTQSFDMDNFVSMLMVMLFAFIGIAIFVLIVTAFGNV